VRLTDHPAWDGWASFVPAVGLKDKIEKKQIKSFRIEGATCGGLPPAKAKKRGIHIRFPGMPAAPGHGFHAHGQLSHQCR